MLLIWGYNEIHYHKYSDVSFSSSSTQLCPKLNICQRLCMIYGFCVLLLSKRFTSVFNTSIRELLKCCSQNLGKIWTAGAVTWHFKYTLIYILSHYCVHAYSSAWLLLHAFIYSTDISFIDICICSCFKAFQISKSGEISVFHDGRWEEGAPKSLVHLPGREIY